jgi:hypothetical protein
VQGQAHWENELVRGCNKWQMQNIRFGSWDRDLKEELDKIGLGSI